MSSLLIRKNYLLKDNGCKIIEVSNEREGSGAGNILVNNERVLSSARRTFGLSKDHCRSTAPSTPAHSQIVHLHSIASASIAGMSMSPTPPSSRLPMLLPARNGKWLLRYG